MCSITNEMTTEVRRDDKGVPLATVTSDALTVHVGRSVEDGVPYVMIDTEAPGVVRVDLNDGNIWDGDPEEDVPAMLDGFEVIPDPAGDPLLVCLDCGGALEASKVRRTLREYVADAKLHDCDVR